MMKVAYLMCSPSVCVLLFICKTRIEFDSNKGRVIKTGVEIIYKSQKRVRGRKEEREEDENKKGY
jgi:hypothetical protein